MTRRRLELEAGVTGAEAVPVQAQVRCRRFQIQGSPTQSEPILEPRAVYALFLFAIKLREWLNGHNLINIIKTTKQTRYGTV